MYSILLLEQPVSSRDRRAAVETRAVVRFVDDIGKMVSRRALSKGIVHVVGSGATKAGVATGGMTVAAGAFFRSVLKSLQRELVGKQVKFFNGHMTLSSNIANKIRTEVREQADNEYGTYSSELTPGGQGWLRRIWRFIIKFGLYYVLVFVIGLAIFIALPLLGLGDLAEKIVDKAKRFANWLAGIEKTSEGDEVKKNAGEKNGGEKNGSEEKGSKLASGLIKALTTLETFVGKLMKKWEEVSKTLKDSDEYKKAGFLNALWLTAKAYFNMVIEELSGVKTEKAKTVGYLLVAPFIFLAMLLRKALSLSLIKKLFAGEKGQTQGVTTKK
jgi:hypothetical protein